MEIRNFTPDDYQNMIDVHTSLDITWPEKPRTSEAWEEVDLNRNPKCKYRRWIAFEDGRVVAFASYG